MKDVFQVVFLIDLDCVSDRSTSRSVLHLKIKTLTRALLKFLTFYATRQCASVQTLNRSDNAYSNLKWGYKYYCPSLKRPIRQQCTFRDFNRQSFEQFERELKDKLVQRLSDCGNVQQPCSSMTLRSSSGAPAATPHMLLTSDASCRKVPAETLELALKELLIDYPWDTPYLSSPVRWTRQQAAGRPKGDLEIAVENVVLVVTGVPRTHPDLEAFLGRAAKENSSSEKRDKERKITPAMILDTILPLTVRQKFCGAAKIQLLWLNVSEFQTLAMNQGVTADNGSTFKLVHQALTKIGGAVIPLNAVMLFQRGWNSDRLKCTDASAAVKAGYPEALEFNIPFTSMMSGFSSECQSENDQQYRGYARLHLHHGMEENLIFNVELLQLFEQNARNGMGHSQYTKTPRAMQISRPSSERQMGMFGTDSSNAVKFFTVTMDTTSQSPNKGQIIRQQFPRDLHPIGTVHLHDIHNLLIARPLVYTCFSNKQEPSSKENSGTFQHLLLELAAEQMAMVVSCDDLYQGILFPENRRCNTALLYVLNHDDQFLLLMENCLNSSLPDDMNGFVQQLLKSWETQVNDFNLPKPQTKPSHPGTGSLSPAYLEKWFQVNQCDKTLMNGIILNSNHASVIGEQQRLFQELQKVYIPLVCGRHQTTARLEGHDAAPCGKLKPSPKFKSVKRQNSIHNGSLDYKCKLYGQKVTVDEQYCGKLENSSPLRCSSYTAELGTGLDSVDMKNEDDLFATLEHIYDKFLHGDNSLRTAAQTVIKSCMSFYKKHESVRNAEMNTRDLIKRHILLKAGDVIRKHADNSGSDKKLQIRECIHLILKHCLQSLIMLEILMVMPSDVKLYFKEITSHLRMLSFVAGPSMLASFLRESIVDNYYMHFKEAVTEICEDLNQPLPGDEMSPSPSMSSNSFFSPEKITESASVSLFSQLSALSTASSSSNQSKSFKLRRSDSIIRHPSFDMSQKRQIAIPHQKDRKEFKEKSYTDRVTRSAEKKLREEATGGHDKREKKNVHRNLFRHSFPATNKHVTPAKRKKPTTPQGRHVLRTKRVAETPVSKQVSQAMLKKQLLKRKRTSEEDDEDEIVEESPDRQPGFVLRRSPRRHASSLQRQSSFYSASQALPRSIQDTWQATLQRKSTNKAKPPCPLITPERRAKAKRHLNLDCFSPNRTKSKNKTPQKENASVRAFGVRRSPRFKSQDEHAKQDLPPSSKENETNRRSPFKLCDNQTLSTVIRKSPRICAPNSSQKDAHFMEAFLSSLKTPTLSSCKTRVVPSTRKKGSPRRCRVARKLLQTPSKKSCNTPHAISHNFQQDEGDIRIPLTPMKDGLESPDPQAPNNFMFGPLCNDFDCSSTSSSPAIPLMYDENIFFDYNEQENFDSLQFLNDAINSEPFDQCMSSDENCNIQTAILSTHSSNQVAKWLDVPDSQLPTPLESACMTHGNHQSSNEQSVLQFEKTCESRPELLSRQCENNVQQATTSKLLFKQKDTNSLSISLQENMNTSCDMIDSTHDTDTAFFISCPLQRFTRQSSKELGISLDIFKQLSNDLPMSAKVNDTDVGEFLTPKQRCTGLKSFTGPQKHEKGHTRASVSKPNIKYCKFTSPDATSLLHLTTAPLSTRITRQSLKFKR